MLQGKLGTFFVLLKKKVKTSKTEKRLVKMVSENNFYNSASKLMKQNLLVGVILDQNCIQILDATLNDLFFFKNLLYQKQFKYAKNIGIAQIREAPL